MQLGEAFGMSEVEQGVDQFPKLGERGRPGHPPILRHEEGGDGLGEVKSVGGVESGGEGLIRAAKGKKGGNTGLEVGDLPLLGLGVVGQGEASHTPEGKL